MIALKAMNFKLVSVLQANLIICQVALWLVVSTRATQASYLFCVVICSVNCDYIKH